jgi:hypothetical protein
MDELIVHVTKKNEVYLFTDREDQVQPTRPGRVAGLDKEDSLELMDELIVHVTNKK